MIICDVSANVFLNISRYCTRYIWIRQSDEIAIPLPFTYVLLIQLEARLIAGNHSLAIHDCFLTDYKWKMSRILIATLFDNVSELIVSNYAAVSLNQVIAGRFSHVGLRGRNILQSVLIDTAVLMLTINLPTKWK